MVSVAIVHDYIVERAGSERVLVSMHRAFPDAPIHTAFFRPSETYPELRAADVRPFAIDRIALLRNKHRAALPLLPRTFGRARIDADVVICGTSGWSAGVQTRGRKVLYIHAPSRWLNDQEAFLAGRPRVERVGLRLIEPRLRRWDRAAVASGDRHLVPSAAMAATIRDAYGIGATVLPPPVTIDPGGDASPPARELAPGFVLCPSRLVVNKRVDVLLDAFRLRPDDRLVVAGGGPELDRLRALAPPNATLIGPAEDPQMRWLLTHCRMVVSASHESFGLISVEAAAFGKPAAVLRHGGFVDTVIEDETGAFFDEPLPDAVKAAIDRVDSLAPDPSRLRRHAAQWDEATFIDRLRAIVAEEGTLVTGLR